MKTEPDYLAQPCRTCGAEPGQPCVMKRSSGGIPFHAPRQDQAAKAFMREQADRAWSS